MPVTSAQCFIETENYPDASMLLKYGDDDNSKGYGQTKEVVRALTKDDSLQPYISDNAFRPSNIRFDDIGYNLYVFDIRYQQNFTASQPIKVEFKIDGVVPYDINGYVFVLTNKLISLSSDGQKRFGLIQV